MAVGRGVAAFIDGAVQGVNIRHAWKDRKRRQQIEDEALEMAKEDRLRRQQAEDEDRSWMREERGHVRNERQRVEDTRTAFADAYADAVEANRGQGEGQGAAGAQAAPDAPPVAVEAAPTLSAKAQPTRGVRSVLKPDAPAAPQQPAAEGAMPRPQRPPHPGQADPALMSASDSRRVARTGRFPGQGDDSAPLPETAMTGEERRGARTGVKPPVPSDVAAPRMPGAAMAAYPKAAADMRSTVPPVAAPVPSAAPGRVATTPSQEIAEATAPGTMPVPVDETQPGRSIMPAMPKAASAKARVETFLETYARVAVPQIMEHYLEIGEPDKAMAFDAWARSQDTRAGMEAWAKGVHAASIGDEAGFITAMFDAYDTDGYYDDGYSIVREKSSLDREGGGVKATLTFRNDATGEETSTTFDDIEDIYQFGVHMLSPEAARAGTRA